VYALGVILYEMLTGKFPYEVVGNMRNVLDRILKSEPAKPSTIRRQINDEVETIVLKCLSKERERRYQTAGELARDVGHYLNGEPIEAKRDSGVYLLKKTLRRYRIPVAIAMSFVGLLSASLVSTWGLYWRAENTKRSEASP
jgi:serine/threonine protein kinase